MGMMYSRGLVAGYPFENTANDILGVNNGTVNGAAYVDGQCGRALSFDAIDDYVDLGTCSELNLQEFTICCTFKFNGAGSHADGNFIFTKGRTGNSPYLSFGLRQVPSQKKLQFVLGATDNTITYIEFIGTFDHLDTTTWHFVAISYDGANVRLYVNGVLNKTVVYTKTIKYTGVFLNENLYIGKWGGTTASQRLFKGVVDNYKHFNRVLSNNEIKKLYLNLGI